MISVLIFVFGIAVIWWALTAKNSEGKTWFDLVSGKSEA